MSEDELSAEEAEVEAVSEVEEQVDENPQSESADDTEARARVMGWRPKDEYSGDPAKWTSAEEFVRRGEEILPIVKANNRTLEKALKESKAEVADLKATMAKFQGFLTKAEQRAYERARRDLEAELVQAVEFNDVEGVLKINKKIVDLNDEMRAEAEPVEPDAPRLDEDTQEALDAFTERNPWFKKDRVMTVAAIEFGEQLAAKGIVGPDQIAEVERRMRREFPEKFENQRRKAPATVEGAGAISRTKTKGYSDLSPEAKAECDAFIRTIPGFTKEKYIKGYFS